MPKKWWNDNDFGGASFVEDPMFVGVVEQPEYVTTGFAYFVADGGTGIANLDRGGAAYAKLPPSGREVVLYRFQSNGFGSTNTTKAIAESVYIQTK